MGRGKEEAGKMSLISEMKALHAEAKALDAQALRDKKRFEEEKTAKNNRLILLEQTQAFLQKIANETQEHLKFQIEDIVNLALETCFPNEYEFSIIFDIRAGKTEASLSFISKKTGREIDPMNASGGGVVDLTAFALRIASYALDRTCDNVIILDEPYRFISRDLQSRAGEILKNLSEKLNLQIIMVTHIGELIDVADRVFEVKKDSEGISRVTVK